MRVVAVVPLYPTPVDPPPAGSRVGAWLSTHECLIALVEAGHHVDVVSTMATVGGGYILDGVRVHPRGRLAQIGLKANVVISHLGPKDTASRWGRRNGKKVVRMAHGSTSEWGDVIADLIVFNSEALRLEAADKKGWTGPSIVIPPPVWPLEFLTKPGREVTLINISPAKGGVVFWELAERMPEHRFFGVMGGYGGSVGPHGSKFEKPRDVRLPNVEVIRPVTHMADLVYSRTRVLLMPSEKETYGRTAMEAAVSGIPTIAHPTPGLLTTLGPDGIFVDRDDIDGWEDALRRLLESEGAWILASVAALELAATLDPEADLARFVAAVEGL